MKDEKEMTDALQKVAEDLYTKGLRQVCMDRGYPHVAEDNEKLAEAITVIEKLETLQKEAEVARGKIAKFAADWLNED